MGANLFMMLKKEIISFVDVRLSYLIPTYSKLIPKAIIEKLNHKYKCTSFSMFDIGMKVKIWGFLEMMLYILNIFLNNILKAGDEAIRNFCIEKKIKEQLQLGIEAIATIQSKFIAGTHKGLEVFSKVFDCEWKFIILREFGLHYNFNPQKVKKNIEKGLKAFGFFTVLITLAPKF